MSDDKGHTVSLDNEVIAQGTVGVTVKITSLYDSQPFWVITVRRIVAVGLDTVAVVVKEVSSRNVTLPLTTVHFTLVTESPGLGVATPANWKFVDKPAEHFVWLGPASATPKAKVTWIGLIKSAIVADEDAETLVFIKRVLIPNDLHGSIAALNTFVKFIAASANVFFS